jgi:hypothetical protein
LHANCGDIAAPVSRAKIAADLRKDFRRFIRPPLPFCAAV